jgi:hypothetical protein
MSSINASYVPWNEEMEVTLLNLIVSEGVHVAPRSESTKKWNTLNELLPYKAAAYKKDDIRKLKDKYQKILKTAKADIDTGNQSGKTGDLSRKYELVQQIFIAMDAEEEEKKDTKKEKEQLNTIEGQTLNGNRPNPLKKRDLDGNIVDSSDLTKKPKINTFESAMLNFLAGPDGTKNAGSGPEDVTKDVLLKLSQGTTLEMMLEEAAIRNADEETVEILYDIGIELMIEIYCTRGWAFGAEKFKDAMERMQVKPIVAHKLYRVLERWRVLSQPINEFESLEACIWSPGSCVNKSLSSPAVMANTIVLSDPKLEALVIKLPKFFIFMRQVIVSNN